MNPIHANTLQTQRLLLDRECHVVANKLASVANDIIVVGRRVKTVLGSDAQILHVQLELLVKLVVGLLDKELVSLIVDYHFESAQV